MLNRRTAPKPHGRSDLDQVFYEPDYITYADILIFIKRHAFIIATCLILGLLLATLYVSTATPLYTARAQMLIDPSTTQVLQDRRTELTLDAAHIQSQIEVIRSDTIATAVIKSLKLLEDPEFQAGQKSWLKKMLSGGSDRQSAKPGNDLSDYQKLRIAIGALQSRLDVRRSGVSYVIDISVTTTDPDKSARIANAIARAYEQAQVAARANAARQNSEWLETRIYRLRNKLDNAARALQSFKAGRGYASPEGGEKKADGKAPTTVEALQATVEAYRKIYEGYYQAFTNAVEQQSFPVSNARIIAPAAPPLSKSRPRSKLILVFGVFAGLLLGVGIAFLRHVMDRSIRTPKQIRDRIGLECMARIPWLAPPAKISFTHSFPFVTLRTLPTRNFARFNQVAEAPFSQFSGAIKALKTAVIKAGGQESIRSLGITSALPEEGKSTLVANLAAAFARSAYKTLIIDADIHNSVISRTFAPHAKRGLLEALTGAADLDKCIVSGKDNTPDVLPVVLPKQDSISYDLLGSQNMLDLLNSLQESYHIVLLDMPPLAPIADGLSMSSLLDGVLLAVEWGKTPEDLLADVSYGLSLADARLLGVVLTKVDESAVHLRLKKAWKYY